MKMCCCCIFGARNIREGKKDSESSHPAMFQPLDSKQVEFDGHETDRAAFCGSCLPVGYPRVMTYTESSIKYYVQLAKGKVSHTADIV